MSTRGWSVNERAEQIVGRRLTPEQEEHGGVVPIDMPTELGYRCPVHNHRWDNNLLWSEYNSFLWCAACNRDYPAALCVPFAAQKDVARPWMNAGLDDATKVFLDSVAGAVARRDVSGNDGGEDADGEVAL